MISLRAFPLLAPLLLSLALNNSLSFFVFLPRPNYHPLSLPTPSLVMARHFYPPVSDFLTVLLRREGTILAYRDPSAVCMYSAKTSTLLPVFLSHHPSVPTPIHSSPPIHLR